MGFFGFLRSGDMTVPRDTAFDPGTHLTPNCPQKASKNVYGYFHGKMYTDLCPVTAMLGYLLERGRGTGPLCMFKDGCFLTRQRLVGAFRGALQVAGMDPRKFGGHNFKIGAATTAAAAVGMEEAVIKTLEQWSSLDNGQVLSNYEQVVMH